MVNQSAEELMKNTLLVSEELPADFHRAAYNLATTRNNPDLLIALVKRSDSPKDLEELYRKNTSAPVRVAYLSRKGLDPKILKEELHNEKRAGVLSGVLKGTDVSDETRKIVEDVFMAKPTKALASVLVNEGSAKARLKALQTLEGGFASMSANMQDNLRKVVSIVSEGLDPNDVVEGLNEGGLLRDLLRNDKLSAKSRVKVIEQVGEYLFGKTRGYNVYGWRLDRARADFLKEVRAVVQSSDDPKIEEAVLKLRSYDMSWDRERTFEEMLAVSGLGVDPNGDIELETPAGKLNAASVSRDQSILRLLIDFALEQRSESLAKRLLMNPNLSADAIMRLSVNNVFHFRAAHLAKAALNHKDDLEIVDELYVRNLSGVLSEIGLSAYPDAETGTRRLMVRLCKEWENAQKNAPGNSWHRSGGWLPRSYFVSLANNPEVDLDCVIKYLPWKAIEGSKSWEFRNVMVALAERQVKLLGTNPSAWETFAVLANDFTGTVEELMTAAQTLS